jgi:membrane-bound ClpP family serine protease
MKKLAVVFASALAFSIGMSVVTFVVPTDRAMADSAGTVIVYPEQASACDGTNC